MSLRSRMGVLIGALVFGCGVLATTGIAAADDDPWTPPPWAPPWAQLCAGQPPTVYWPFQAATNGPDVILGTPGADNIDALAGDDIICGLGDNDLLSGGAGNDHVFGQGDDDTMFGNAGMDVLNGGPHNLGDSGNGGLGADSCPATEFVTSC